MKYFLLKSKEQALATPGAYLNEPFIDMEGEASLTPAMFSIVVNKLGQNITNLNDRWGISFWMIQQEISPETHPEYFI